MWSIGCVYTHACMDNVCTYVMFPKPILRTCNHVIIIIALSCQHVHLCMFIVCVCVCVLCCGSYVVQVVLECVLGSFLCCCGILSMVGNFKDIQLTTELNSR